MAVGEENPDIYNKLTDETSWIMVGCPKTLRGCQGRYRMVVGFITTYAIIV
jgi:hypothetical protein